MRQKLIKLFGCSDVCYPILISLFYLVGALLWIFTTDDLLYKLAGDYHNYRYYETLKSLFFVALSAVIIFYLIRLNNKKLKASLIKQNAAKQDIVSLFDATLDKIAIISKNGKIIGHNNAFLSTWPFDVLDDTLFLDGIFQDDKEAMNAQIQKVFEYGNAVDFENRFFDADGKYAWHSWRIARSGDGSKVYLIGRNISHQKENQEVLVREKENCLWLLDNMPLPMWKNGVDGGCEYLNQAWFDFTGTDAQTQLGDGWLKTIHPDDAQECFDSYMKALKNEESWNMEYRLLHKGGEYRWVCDNGKPLYSQIGEYIGYVGAIYDINDRKVAQEQLIKKEELLIVQSRFAAMGEMISMIAHQWRQPITVIGMSANNMILDIELQGVDNERFISHLKGISEQVQYLSKTIDDFRNFFKPNIQKEIVSVGELVQKAIKMVSKSYENNGIAISTKETQANILIDVHFGEMLQSMLSILNNAKDVLMDRSVKNPFVEIRVVGMPDKHVTIEIEDNGGGIDDSIIDKIFEPYFTTKNEKSGTGLGLYMAKIIVEKHHAGVLSVKNSGSGALFAIEIPLSEVL